MFLLIVVMTCVLVLMMMKVRVRNVLSEAIERGIRHALMNTDRVAIDEPDITYLTEEIDSSVWLQVDDYFTFDFD